MRRGSFEGGDCRLIVKYRDKIGCTDRDAVWDAESGGSREPLGLLDEIHISDTWRMRLNRPCAAAMQPYVKLLWPIVISMKSYVKYTCRQRSKRG